MKRDAIPRTEARPYAVVRDVLAGWDHYAPLAAALTDPVPAGLVLHAAGPTLAGFRTIEVWESEETCLRFELERLNGLLDGLAMATLVRELEVHELVAQPGIAQPVRDFDALQRVIDAARLVA